MRMTLPERDELASIPIAPDSRVGDVALTLPDSIDVFERHGIDFCCGGNRTLAEACARASVPLDSVLPELSAVAARARSEAGAAAPGPLDAEPTATALIDHIVATHHAFVRAELARLPSLAARVVAAHGARHPTLARVERLVERLRSELEPHLEKEERVLFPYVTALDAFVRDGGAAPAACFRTVRDPIRAMEYEHDLAGELLADLRRTTDGYEPPDGLCATTRALFDGLLAFERDLHRHIHLENNALFPRAVALEERR
jgi:regulator of cell morphogenesis and NO signaling